jgi:hypothetical protein
MSPSLSRPGDYPLSLLRGKHFIRIDESRVEIFSQVFCYECGDKLLYNAMVLREPSDERLLREGLLSFSSDTKLERAHLMHIHGDYLCPSCYRKWLKPSEARHD